MLDETLPSVFQSARKRPRLRSKSLRSSRSSRSSRPNVILPMSSLLDQSALTDLAERLVTSARRAGADAADALALRSVSLAVEVREGAVEESERSEGDDMGLRVFVGRRQAVVSTNDVKADVAAARRARGRHGAGRARGSLRRSCRSRAARARHSRPRPAGSATCPTVALLEERAQARRERGARGQRRDQVGRRLGVRRHRRHGAGDQPRLSRRLSQLRPERLDDGDRGGGHRDGARLRLFLRAARGRSRTSREGRPYRRRAHGRAAQSAQGRDQARAGRVRSAGRRLARRSSRQRHQRRRGRAQNELPQGQARASGCSSPASACSTIRCAGAACARARSTPKASPADALP